VESKHLDFTYLFHESVENSDHERLGKGVRIRSSDEIETAVRKRARTASISIEVRTCERLAEALAEADGAGRR
jgi:hypothetical protein